MRRLAWLTILSAFALELTACAEATSSEADAAMHVDGGFDQRSPDSGNPINDGAMTPRCDLGSSVDGGEESLFVSATAADGTAYAAERRNGTWAIVSAAGAGLSSLVATSFAGRPVVIGRQTNDALVAATTDACVAQLPAPMPLFSMALTAERPAPIGGATIDLVFRGSISGDERLFYTRYDGSWQPPTALGNFLSTLPPVALRSGAQIHVLFTGTDNKLYDGTVDTNGGAATQLPNATSDHGPAGITSADGITYVSWKGDDTNLYYTMRVAGGAYAAPLALCTGQTSCLIASNDAPVTSLDSSGAPTAAWIGKSDGFVYTSRYDVGSAAWSAALAATTEASTLLPALAPGLSDSALELVYVRASDGQGRHVRKLGAVFSSAVDLPGAKIGSRPSLLRVP